MLYSFSFELELSAYLCFRLSCRRKIPNLLRNPLDANAPRAFCLRSVTILCLVYVISVFEGIAYTFQLISSGARYGAYMKFALPWHQCEFAVSVAASSKGLCVPGIGQSFHFPELSLIPRYRVQSPISEVLCIQSSIHKTGDSKFDKAKNCVQHRGNVTWSPGPWHE